MSLSLTANRAGAASAEIIRARAGADPIEIAIVLGSGLGGLAGKVEAGTTIAYADLPGFPGGGVSGHAAMLHIGRLGGRRVAVMAGREHYYEHANPAAMRPALETLALLGARRLLLTNAAGSFRPEVGPTAIVAHSDFVNWSGRNPLIGEAGDARFVDMREAYSPALRARLQAAAQRAGIVLHEGVYFWFSGPTFETPAEIRAMRALGADLVGMSTVPEVIIARRLGLEVAALSMVTNHAAGMAGAEISHHDTKTVAAKGAAAMEALVTAFLAELGNETAVEIPKLEPQQDPHRDARRTLALLDLTNLDEGCAEADIDALCAKAIGPPGPVAAVCVWPRFIAQARARLEGSLVKVATVINFPAGTDDRSTIVADTDAALEAGADEIDFVLPYALLLRGMGGGAAAMVRAVRWRVPRDRVLKVILETGALPDAAAIRLAADIAIREGADFIKTSTGKIAKSATPEAVAVMLEAIRASDRPVGLKPSGGIRTLDDARAYLALADEVMGPDWARPTTFRFGASGLHGALLATLAGTEPTGPTGY